MQILFVCSFEHIVSIPARSLTDANRDATSCFLNQARDMRDLDVHATCMAMGIDTTKDTTLTSSVAKTMDDTRADREATPQFSDKKGAPKDLDVLHKSTLQK